VSIYTQIFLIMLLGLLAPSHAATKSLFRNAIVTLYAIYIALEFAHREQGYSEQQQIVVSSLACGLGPSAWSMMFVQPSPLKRYNLLNFFALLILGAVALVKLLGAPDCSDFAVSRTRAGGILFPVGLILGFLIFCIAIFYRMVPTGHRKNMARRCLILAWVLFSLVTVIGSEVNMGIYVYIREDGQIDTLNTTSWGLGQVMAVVMLASQLREIGASYVERSTSAMENFVARTRQRIRYPTRGRPSTTTHLSPGFERLEDSAHMSLEGLGQEVEGRIIDGGGNLTGHSKDEMESATNQRRDTGVQVSGVSHGTVTNAAILVDVSVQTDENVAICVDVTTQTDQHSART